MDIVGSQHKKMEAAEGPITKARAKRFKEELNFFLKSFFEDQDHRQESKPVCVQLIQALEDQIATGTSNWVLVEGIKDILCNFSYFWDFSMNYGL